MWNGKRRQGKKYEWNQHNTIQMKIIIIVITYVCFLLSLRRLSNPQLPHRTIATTFTCTCGGSVWFYIKSDVRTWMRLMIQQMAMVFIIFKMNSTPTVPIGISDCYTGRDAVFLWPSQQHQKARTNSSYFLHTDENSEAFNALLNFNKKVSGVIVCDREIRLYSSCQLLERVSNIPRIILIAQHFSAYSRELGGLKQTLLLLMKYMHSGSQCKLFNFDGTHIVVPISY